MARRHIFFGSFRFKITVLFILLMFLSGVIGNFLVYDYALKSQMKQLRERLMVIAQMIALNVDAPMLLEIPLNEKGADTPQYKRVENELIKIRAVAPSIAYIYILTKTDKECVFKFMIDLHPGSYKTEIPPARPGKNMTVRTYPR